MRTHWIPSASVAVTCLVLAACSAPPDASTLNTQGGAPPATNGGSSDTAGTTGVGQGGSSSGGTSFGGAPATGGSSPQPGTAGSAQPGGTAGLPGTGGSTIGGAAPVAGTAGSEPIPMGGSAGTEPVGGSAGTEPMGGSAGTQGGSAGAAEAGPYAPRTGSFKMLVYSQVIAPAFRHGSIAAGQRMLQGIGQKQGFEVTIAANESEINPAGLANYEIVFFLNSTGEIFNAGNQRRDFEAWMREKGAYAGMHGATDSAQSWQFYKEITGQYYDLHDTGVTAGTIQWTAAGQNHVVGQGLPNPWPRNEEWYRFRQYADWSTKAGFTILNTVTTSAGGTRPVSFVREWGNFRAFYTSLGHDDAPYSDANVIKHVTAGIMWAVRREALIVP